jgi:hypothetical protein
MWCGPIPTSAQLAADRNKNKRGAGITSSLVDSNTLKMKLFNDRLATGELSQCYGYNTCHSKPIFDR